MNKFLDFIVNTNLQDWYFLISVIAIIVGGLYAATKKAIWFFQQDRHKKNEQKAFVKRINNICKNIIENPRKYDKNILLKRQHANFISIKNLEQIKSSNLPLWLKEKDKFERTYELSNEHNEFIEQAKSKNSIQNLAGKHPGEIYDNRISELLSLSDELLEIIKKYDEK